MDQLYAKDQKVPFETLFTNPGSLYRDTPFWAWNCALTEDVLRRQIGIFQEMGMGGFHMHSRTGTVTPYLSPDFMKLVNDCVDEAKKRNMLAWLYDEDRWPSGSAGGLVTKNPKFRGRHAVVRFAKYTQTPEDVKNDNAGSFLAAYTVKLDSDGFLTEYHRCGEDDPVPAGFRKIWCYLFVNTKNSWFNDEAYVDTLNESAIKEFIKVTHETYYRSCGNEFSKTVPAIFTDEPQFTRKGALEFAQQEAEVALPYTNDFPETYRAAYGCDFFDTLPELIWELRGKYSLARYRYHDHAAERFAHSFADTIGDWCKAHNIQSTGHMMNEASLLSQTMSLGDCMRSYRSFLLPGIDMLCDRMELSTAKQAQSASRQFGRGGVLSELNGVTDWDFPFLGHKGHGDWQAALGVTVRVPHLSWVSMAGESKRDYPASISYQSPWYKKYPIIADHFARVNTAMTRGRALARIGVVHPVESYWLLYGPKDQTAVKRDQAETDFSNLFNWLLFGLLDFDLLGESILPVENVHVEGRELVVGEMRYSTIVVPPCITLRSTTLAYLEEFRKAGGDLIFAGAPAELCDAVPSDRAAKLAGQCRNVPFSRAALTAALEDCRDVRVLNAWNGYPADNLIYQMREDGADTRYVFIVDTDRYGAPFHGKVMFRGTWQVELLDTFTGKITALQSELENGWTVFTNDFYADGHLLLRLSRKAAENAVAAADDGLDSGEACPEKIAMGGREVISYATNTQTFEGWIAARVEGRALPVTLDEPNVLLLDLAEWRVNGGEWQKREEILRLDGYARAKLGVSPKSSVQPWAQHISDKVYGTLDIRYTVKCDVAVSGTYLALEQPETSRIFLDGKEIPFKDCGFWTDECLRKMPLGSLSAGNHELIVQRVYTDRTNVERIYLLGDFGVSVCGDDAIITAPVRTLHWGDIAPQGLPFYGGNITYHASFVLDQDEPAANLYFPQRSGVQRTCSYIVARETDFCAFRGTLIGAAVDGKEAGDIAFAPFRLALGKLAKGAHKLDLTLYGNRQNAFGANHLSGRIAWTGPNAWRTEGDDFSYDYLLIPLGIMRSPFITR